MEKNLVSQLNVNKSRYYFFWLTLNITFQLSCKTFPRLFIFTVNYFNWLYLLVPRMVFFGIYLFQTFKIFKCCWWTLACKFFFALRCWIWDWSLITNSDDLHNLKLELFQSINKSSTSPGGVAPTVLIFVCAPQLGCKQLAICGSIRIVPLFKIRSGLLLNVVLFSDGALV